MAIEIVDLPTEHGDVPHFFVNIYQRVMWSTQFQKYPIISPKRWEWFMASGLPHRQEMARIFRIGIPKDQRSPGPNSRAAWAGRAF